MSVLSWLYSQTTIHFHYAIEWSISSIFLWCLFIFPTLNTHFFSSTKHKCHGIWTKRMYILFYCSSWIIYEHFIAPLWVYYIYFEDFHFFAQFNKCYFIYVFWREKKDIDAGFHVGLIFHTYLIDFPQHNTVYHSLF